MHKQANMICTGKKKGVFLPSEWKDPGTEFHLTWQGLHVHQPGQISEHHFHLLCNRQMLVAECRVECTVVTIRTSATSFCSVTVRTGKATVNGNLLHLAVELGTQICTELIIIESITHTPSITFTEFAWCHAGHSLIVSAEI